MRRPIRILLRFALSALLLVLLLRWFDGPEILTRLAQLDYRWVVPALTLSVLQVLLLAWRWRFTAARLGLYMTYPVALREYYLGVFLNQLLPGGVLGDVSRAWRHARASTRTRTAVHAVVLERVMLQSVMLVVAALSLLALPALWLLGNVWLWLAVATVIAAAVIPVLLQNHLPRLRSAVVALTHDARRAFLPGKALIVQLGSSVLFVGVNLAVFVASARAVGAEIPLLLLLPLIAPVLLAMMIPFTVGGWGMREGAAALLWGLSGFSPSEGIAIGIAYGLLFLLAALPGALPLLLGHRIDPARSGGSNETPRRQTPE